jgi:hypothetical protein
MPPPHTPIHTPTHTPAHTHQSPTSATRLPPPTPPTSPMKQHGERETTGLLVSGQAVTKTMTRSELPCFHDVTHEVAAAEVFDRRRPSQWGGGGGGCCEGLGRYVHWWLFGWKEERVGGEGWGAAGVRTLWGGGGSLLQRERERERERESFASERAEDWALSGGGGGVVLCVWGGGRGEAEKRRLEASAVGSDGRENVARVHMQVCSQTLNPKH